MLLGSIDFPSDVIAARDAGELVVFAGAGVSIPPPSSLPSFKQLAERIGATAGIGFESNETADHYLGRLKMRGINVHEASARILVNDGTKPHTLHGLLLGLFPSRETVRLITTNFDTHFSSAAHDLFGSGLEIYYAPALPLGNDFAGLVYLHGCAGKDPNRCVLTDEDFGHAYLTEAWAARFIASMFSRYVVVFVGYSYSDIVMTYLARGLPPKAQRPRFAFSVNDDDSLRKWTHLSIKPLLYSKTDGTNSHQELTDSVVKLVEVLNLGLLGEEQRIESILKSPPPLESEDADFIKFALSKLDSARIFFRHARSLNLERTQWLTWMERHGLLKPLFDPDSVLEEPSFELMSWLADQFVGHHTQELLSAIHRNGGRLHRWFCFHIYRVLFSRESNPRIHSQFSQWIALLLSQEPDALSRQEWVFLATKCQIPIDKTVVLLIFDRLIRPRIVLDEELSFSLDFEQVTKKTAFSLNLFGDKDIWTGDIWKKVLKPNLASLEMELEPIVSANLTAADSLMNLTQIPDYDPLYLHRESVEWRGTIPKLLDVLIDAARDIIIHLANNDSARASALINRWFLSDAPILKRLAVFGYSLRNDVSANDKLKWLLENDLLFRFHAEVRAVLKATYALSEKEVRRELLDRAAEGPTINIVDDEWRENRIYELLMRLNSLAPDCELTSKQLKEFLENHPRFVQQKEIKESAQELSDRFMTEQGGFDTDKIIAIQPHEFLEELLQFPDLVQREYRNAASAATQRTPEWGIEWIKELILRELDQPNLWSCIAQGWKAADLSAGEWHVLFSFLLNVSSAPKEFFLSLIELLVEGAKRESFNIPDAEMELAQAIAERIWNETLTDTAVDEQRESQDWLTVAINNPGGRIAEFWLQRVSALRRLSNDAWEGIPVEILLPLRRMILGGSGASAHLRIVLASQAHYFFAVDSRFTTEELIPLFDWQQDALRAEQSWHGFLIWGRLQPGLLDALLPHFTNALKHITAFPKEMRNRLAESSAVVAVYGIQNPLGNEFLTAAFQNFEEPDLLQFAWGIGNLLERADDSVIHRVWNGWLKEYWQRRSMGLPKQLSSGEANIMASWTIDLGKFFPEAVKMLALFNGRLTFEHSRILIDLEEKEMIKNYPDASADLLLLYLRSPKTHLYGDQHGKKLWIDLKDSGIQPGKLKQVREAMYRKLNIDPEEL